MKAREYAAKVLGAVYVEGAYAGNLLRERPQDITDQDFALAVKIIYGTLSNYLYLRYQWQPFLRGRLPERIKVLIDSAIYQLRFLDSLPDYAVISETVELAKQNTHGSYAGVVNAILRNYLNQGPKEPEGSEETILSVRTSVPEWLIRLWEAHYGKEEARRLAEGTLREKPMCYRVRRGADYQRILDEYPEGRPGGLAARALVIDRRPADLAAFRRGELAVQDQASQLSGEWVAAKPGEAILDMCAAPGTKTIQIAESLEGKGRVLATDLYPERVKMIAAEAKRQGLRVIEARAADARDPQALGEPASFAAVLLDAPCSGLGVLRDKPDIKLRIRPESLDELTQTQRALLESAAVMVKPGGRIIYSTCTLDKKENERQVAAFLADHDSFRLIKERTVYPEEDDTDGFYLARIDQEVLK